MKLNNLFLCCESTCEEVFEIDTTSIQLVSQTVGLGIRVHNNIDTPFDRISCPVCGNKNIRSINRLLANRR